MSGSLLASAVKNGQFVVTAECVSPRGTDADGVRACAAALGTMAHALCASEGNDGVRMSSAAACAHLSAAGAEPILSLLTRDLNRIALQSSILGAASMGIRNVLCAAGKHQALTSSVSARGVFDVDPIQLLSIADGIRKEGKLADGEGISPVDLVLGVETNPFADPMELQVMTLEKAVRAGADFVITQPVSDLKRLDEWMELVRGREIHKRTCIIASVMPMTDNGASDKRQAAIDQAAETVKQIRNIEGIRGVHLMTGEDYDLAVQVLKSAGVSRS